MSNKICTCKWSINVFHNSVSTCRERDILWELYKRERNVMKRRGNNLSGDDGNSLLRICITIRDDVIMRSNSNNKLSISSTICGG